MSLNAGFSQTSAQLVGERGGLKIFWNNGTDLDKEAAEKLGRYLKTSSPVDDAVQIALLNNRELQAVYSDLGVAQADLVQAGLLNNPIFDGAIKWPIPGGGKPDLELARGYELSRYFLFAAAQASGGRPRRGSENSGKRDGAGFCGASSNRLLNCIRQISKCSNCARQYYRR